MGRIKKFEAFELKWEDNEKYPQLKKASFRLGDALETAKLINVRLEDFEDGEDSIISFNVNEQYPSKPVKVGDDEYKLEYLRDKWDFGYLVLKNGEPLYIVSIYEPGAYKISDRGLLTITGHEEVVNIWLDDGHWERFHTR